MWGKCGVNLEEKKGENQTLAGNAGREKLEQKADKINALAINLK